MLNFHEDYKNLTQEQLRFKGEALQDELKSISKRIEAHPKSATSDVNRRVSDISDWLDAASQPEYPNGDPRSYAGQPTTGLPTGPGSISTAGQEQRHLKLGQFLQCVAAAATPAGERFGLFDSGKFYMNVLSPEARSSGLEESTPSLGGFLVGSDESRDLIKKAHETSKLFDRTRKIPISNPSNSLKIPYIDETSRANGSRLGGIQSFWQSEGSTKTDSKPKFGLLELSLKKLIGLCYGTDELLQDAEALGAIISQGFAEEIGFKLDDGILNGTGSGQLLGLLNANCLVSVAKESGQTAKTLIWENIKKMWAQFWPGSYSNGIWIISQSCWLELMSMSESTGTGGVPVWMPANLAKGRPNSTLMGMPVIVAEQCQTLGTKGDIYLADLSQYIVATKGAIQMASSIHVKFTTDETTFRFVYRVDGQPSWHDTLTPYKDATTSAPLSPFIVLATRA